MKYYFGWFQSMGYAAMGCGHIVDIEPSKDWRVAYERARHAVCSKHIVCTASAWEVDAIFPVPTVFDGVPEGALTKYFLDRCPTAFPGKPLTSAPGWWWTRREDAAQIAVLDGPAK